jgi:hypothetical protein
MDTMTDLLKGDGTPTMKERTKLLEAMETTGCTYYDYEPRSLAQWHKSLANSEVHKYAFITDNIAVHKFPGGSAIKVYDRNNVSTWILHQA